MIPKKRKLKGSVKKCKCPNNKLLIIALFSIILFLFLELLIRIYDLYRTAPSVDIASHFLGGIAAATTIYWLLSFTLIRNKELVTIILTLVLEAIAELIETLEELIVFNPPYLRDIFFWDGVGDIIVALVGAIFALGFLRFLKKNGHLLE